MLFHLPGAVECTGAELQVLQDAAVSAGPGDGRGGPVGRRACLVGQGPKQGRGLGFQCVCRAAAEQAFDL